MSLQAHFCCTCPKEVVKSHIHVHLVQYIEQEIMAIQHEMAVAHVELYPRVQNQVMRLYLAVTFA